jgi:predicted pyridoxine 5'-phosphate oxidase superfamily flavin-nucleotide-binding protein
MLARQQAPDGEVDVDAENPARIDSLEKLRGVYAGPRNAAKLKCLDRLDEFSRLFIAWSPFFVLASSNAEGRCDASPRGDQPGFVEVVDDKTLQFPDRPGTISHDAALRDRFAVNGKPALAVVRVTVDEVYFHCGKALKRSRLWDPSVQRDRKTFPTHGRILAEQTKVVSIQESEAYVEQSYRERLY